MAKKKIIKSIDRDFNTELSKNTKLNARLISYQQKIKEITILYRNVLNENQKLQSLLKTEITLPDHIPGEIIAALYKDLENDLHLDNRVLNVLHCENIYTLEDLLRFIQKNGLEKLLNCKNMGKLSLCKLNIFLRKNNFYYNGHSIYFQYLK